MTNPLTEKADGLGVAEAIADAMALGREAERAAIVAFLRTKPTWACNRGLINAIEQGDHLK